MIPTFPPPRRILAVLIVLMSAASAAAAESPTLMRFPSSAGEQVAFVARGDLWIAPATGGDATRLVRGEDAIVAARFSPDGRWVAYSQQARGRKDVYVVAAAGGPPVRLTYDARPAPAANLVVAWTPDSERVVFLSDRESVTTKQVQAFSIAVSGGLAERLPMEQSGTLSYSPDGASVAYTRTFNGLAARKRYVGGQADDIYIHSPASGTLERVTDWEGTDTSPMWIDDRIYFLSDRGPGFRLNLWRYDLGTRQFTQLTHFSDFDIDSPALGSNRITFQQGGRLWAYDVASARLSALDINVPDDGTRTAPRRLAGEPWIRDTDVTGVPDYSVAASTVAFSVLGDLFVVDLASGAAGNVSKTPATFEQHPSLSPDGRLLAYVADDDRAQQVAIRPTSGGPETWLTRFSTGALYQPKFSPDGRWLSVATASNALWLVPVDGGHARLVQSSRKREIRDAAFSPDGRWLAYSTVRETGVSGLHLYEIAAGRDVELSDPMESDRLPVFSADSTRLYFVSRRHERALTSDRGDEAAFATVASDGLYVMALGALGGRVPPVSALPVTGGRIVSLQRRGEDLVYASRPVELIPGEDPTRRSQLRAFNLPSRQDRLVMEDFDHQVLAEQGGALVLRRGGQWWVKDITDAGDPGRRIDLAGLKADIIPRDMWAASFEHAWRLDRDLFFSAAMNGNDWAKVRDAYRTLLTLVGSQDDFSYLLRQLQGELATSHAYIADSQAGAVPAPVAARIGADFALDRDSGLYVLQRVYRGDPSRSRFRAPLISPEDGIDVKPGTFVLAVDGSPLAAPMNPDALLSGKSGTVTLTLADGPGERPYDVAVRTLASDHDLRLHDWIQSNRAATAARSGGRLGYMFLGDFAGPGSEDFVRQFQGQLDRDGLVIDIRWNRGGYTSQAILNMLRREHAGIFVNRQRGIEPLPLFVAPRAMAVLTNEYSASDGDQFPYYFRALGLGPVIGQRSWGGVQGIKGMYMLMDGTGITIPKDALASTTGEWLIENHGVEPDVAIEPSVEDLDPGRDRHLETAIQVLMGEGAPAPAGLRVPPPLPAYPVEGNVPGARFHP